MKNASYPTLTLSISVRKTSKKTARFIITDTDSHREVVKAVYTCHNVLEHPEIPERCLVIMEGKRIRCANPLLVEEEIIDTVVDYNHDNNPSSLVGIKVGRGKVEKYYDREVGGPIGEALFKYLTL